ncbi:hypothetical protein ABIE13_003681 [Ottowia thiooxydans]|uniref:Uncharacterized protein n=1 Tax=Ottowia thiooxydans TaxID=219182 RepID=A0ABV2QD90_9BURK
MVCPDALRAFPYAGRPQRTPPAAWQSQLRGGTGMACSAALALRGVALSGLTDASKRISFRSLLSELG